MPVVKSPSQKEAGHPQSPFAEDNLSYEWKRWIAENKMLGQDDESLIKVLIENGTDEQTAIGEVAAAAVHPYFEAGHWIAQKLKKLESLLDVYADLTNQRPSARFAGIERRSDVTREEFLEKYYAANRPVVLLDLMNHWTARTVWSPDYFRATCSDEMVEVMAGRNADPRYEINAHLHKTTMSFGDYIDRITQNNKSNDLYLVANNNLLRRKGLQHLYNDIVLFPEYLDSNNIDGSVYFWFGPGGTVTPLHHDIMNIFMAQVFGRKRITLVPSGLIHKIYNEIGVYSEVDCEKPNYEQFPAFRDVRVQRFVLKPGEVLFIPVGWWHHVRSLDVSVTISFTNFLFANQYHWDHPEIQRHRE